MGFPEMNISENNRRLSKPLEGEKLKNFHVYGQGADPNGISGFAWVKVDTGKRRVESRVGLTKEEAEFMGLIAALEYVGDGSTVRIWMDSQVVCDLFTSPLFADFPHLNALLSRACDLEQEKELRVETRRISRRQNMAAELFAPRRW